MPTKAGAWQPIPYDDGVLLEAMQDSFLENYGNPIPMTTAVERVPRSARGSARYIPPEGVYVPNDAVLGNVTLIARKASGRDDFVMEDIQDTRTIPSLRQDRARAWLISWIIKQDNAALGNMLAPAGDDSNEEDAPFLSILKAVRTDDNSPGIGYTADKNYRKTAAGLTYDDVVKLFRPLRKSTWVVPSRVVIAADPDIQTYLEEIKDLDGRPIWIQSMNDQQPDRILGRPVIWTRGARVSQAATDTPSGNPLMIAVDRQWLLLGKRIDPSVQWIPESINRDQDVATQKYYSRRGFVLGNPFGASVLEVTEEDFD